MNLTSYEFQRWNQKIREIIAQIDTSLIPQLLMEAVIDLVPVDYPCLIVYEKERKPCWLYGALSDKKSMEYFLSAPYLLDPFYRAGIDGIESGCYHLRDIAPPGFKQSEYYRNYYVPAAHWDDEVGYIIQIDEVCFVNIALGRLAGSPRFKRREIILLNTIEPVISGLMERYFNNVEGRSIGRNAQESKLNLCLEAAFRNFGISLLTKREYEVIHCLLRGHNTKSIAKRLDISIATIKLHRSNAYKKLDISTQSELFSIFLDSLSFIEQSPYEDPLAYYMSP